MIETLRTDPRVAVRTPGAPDPDGEAVVYWMQRAQRAADNPALDLAIHAANALRKPVVVFFGLNPFVARANLRHYHFLAEGLADIAAGLRQRRVGFVLRAHPRHRLLPFLDEVRPALLIGDENPLRQTEAWRQQIAERVRVPFWTVDADVIAPTELFEKEQYAARTLRPRITRRLPEFLVPSDEPKPRVAWTRTIANDSREPSVAILDGLRIDRSVAPVSTLRGGSSEGRRHLQTFVRRTLDAYDTARNHPETMGTSVLSPYLHFGHLGPREVALTIQDSGASADSVAAFLEQLIVRRELAVNFTRFNDAYDRLEGCEAWARQTLRRHAHDRRPFVYTEEEFDAAATHDPLWNAAQRQMTDTGWMHGYVRMYWAKKILEWSPDAATAFRIAVDLNDRYELDGRDPNGYANIAWAIGGKHDRPWPTRPIYGTVRSMSFASTSKKFDAASYIEQYGTAADLAAFRGDSTAPATPARRSVATRR